MVTLIQTLIQRRICLSSPIIVVGNTHFIFQIFKSLVCLICFVPSDVEKSELQAVQASKPDGTSAKQVKIVEPNKAEDVDKDTTSDEDSSDEDDVSEAEVFWSIW